VLVVATWVTDAGRRDEGPALSEEVVTVALREEERPA
jgi:hypothetical protein